MSCTKDLKLTNLCLGRKKTISIIFLMKHSPCANWEENRQRSKSYQQYKIYMVHSYMTITSIEKNI